MPWVGPEPEVYHPYSQALAAVDHLGTHKQFLNRSGVAGSPDRMALYFLCLLFLG